MVSGTIESQSQIIIYDTPPLEATMPELVTVPCDETVEVCVELIQDPDYEYPPVTYNWSINGLDYGEDPCVTYGALTSSLMEVYLEDGCGREMYLQGLFDVPYEPLALTMPNDTLLCNGAETFITLGIEEATAYQIAWSDFVDDELSHLVDLKKASRTKSRSQTIAITRPTNKRRSTSVVIGHPARGYGTTPTSRQWWIPRNYE